MDCVTRRDVTGRSRPARGRIDWHGTIVVDLGALESAVIQGSGVATVNDSSGGTHLSTLRLAGGITGSDIIPVTDPNTTGQIKSIIISGTLGGKLGKPQTATLTGISGAPPMGAKNTLPLGGYTRVCIFDGELHHGTCPSTTRRTAATPASASAVS